MIVVRQVESAADVERWTHVRNLVERDNPTTIDELRAGVRRQPEMRHWLAESDGDTVGCAFVAHSSVPGRAFVLPRVVPAARRAGGGSALLAAGLAYAATLGGLSARSHVDGADDDAVRFATRHGFTEVDRQVELVRPLAAHERVDDAVPGIEVAPLAADHVAQVRAVVLAGVEDMPVAGGVRESFAAEVLEELTEAPLRVVAREAGEIVGVAGLLRYGARTDALEHAFTTVARSHRGRGVARALKAACIGWAAANGYRELVTWTQAGNEAMQAVNLAAGFRPGHVSITVERPLA